ncbi:hypothetical protein GGX14DRAFT_468277 [Mycena pura]|uniref:Uncharacterized protein n=1 Tax=Mycena pura TaxID=153505 RepID=A0AAD6Y6H3_9AGAR|nr:hypothetical protein GGX14DRAFT_468277 [Mycena pura]
MSLSPPPPNPSIVNEGNLLPSVNALLGDVSQRERGSPQSASHPQSAWSGFPGPDREVVGRLRPAFPQDTPPPFQYGLRSAGQPVVPPPPPHRRPAEIAHKMPETQWRHTTNAEYPNEARTPEPVVLPVIPNRMGGRYAQTPCHPNGQPHAPGLMPQGGNVRVRQPRQGRGGVPVPVVNMMPPTNEARKRAASDIYKKLLEAAGKPVCAQCQNDIKVESRRQMVATLGPLYAQFAHGFRPQIPSTLPVMEDLITIPFVPKVIPGAQAVYGVSLPEILDFCDVLENPNDRVLDNATSKIYLVMEHPGYPLVVRQLTGNCPHRPASRLSLAYSVAEAYAVYFNTSPPNLTTPPGPPAVVVRSVINLRLVNLYTTDRINYRAHVAYVF